MLLSLPNDILIQIATAGNAKDLVSLFTTCKYLNNLTKLSDSGNSNNNNKLKKAYHKKMNECWRRNCQLLLNISNDKDPAADSKMCEIKDIDLNSFSWDQIYIEIIGILSELAYDVMTWGKNPCENFAFSIHSIKQCLLGISSHGTQEISNLVRNATQKDTNNEVDKQVGSQWDLPINIEGLCELKKYGMPLNHPIQVATFYDCPYFFEYLVQVCRQMLTDSDNKTDDACNNYNVNKDEYESIYDEYQLTGMVLNCHSAKVLKCMFGISSTYGINFDVSLWKWYRYDSASTLQAILENYETFKNEKTEKQREKEFSQFNDIIYDICFDYGAYDEMEGSNKRFDKIFELLICHGCDIDFTRDLDTSNTGLMQLVAGTGGFDGDAREIEEMIEIVLKHGANIHAKNAAGQTPLSIAIAHNNVLAMTILVEKSDKSSLNDTYLYINKAYFGTYLFYSIAMECVDGVMLLMKNGFTNIWIKNDFGQTALSYVISLYNGYQDEQKQYDALQCIWFICGFLMKQVELHGGAHMVHKYITSQGAVSMLDKVDALKKKFLCLDQQVVANQKKS